MPFMDIIVIAGSPATGKTTISNAIQQQLKCAHINLGRIREMYLDPQWARANPIEAQMAFSLACHIAREFIAHGIAPVILEDLRPEMIRQVPDLFSNLNYGIISLFISNKEVLKSRMIDPTRDSGFNDLEAAWNWNNAENSRELLDNEIRIDSTDLTIEKTIEKIITIICSE